MKKFLFLVIPLVLLAVVVSGCYTEEEATYRDRMSKLAERWEALGNKAEAQGKNMEREFSSLGETASIEAMIVLLDKYTAEFSADLNEARAIYGEFSAIAPPKRFETAHSQYNAGMTQEISSVETMVNSLTGVRNNPSYFTVQSLETSLDNSMELGNQAEANYEDANDKVFGFPYDILVIGIVAVLILVGLIAFAIIMLSRRRRRPVVTEPKLPTTCHWCGASITPASPYCPKCGRTIGSFT